MIKLPVNTAVVVPVNVAPLTDDTDFKTRETAVAYNASGMDLVWNFQAPDGTITQTAVTPTTAGVHDWAHLGDGMYTMELPASGGTVDNDTVGYGWWSGIATGVLAWRGPTVELLPQESLWESIYGPLPCNEHGGRVWYVAASGGSSSNPGTQDLPLDTVANAISAANFGDTIALLGSHTTAIDVTSNPGLTIQGGEGASLTVVSGKAIQCGHYTTIRNLAVTATNAIAVDCVNYDHVTIEGCTVTGTQDSINAAGAEHLIIRDTTAIGTWDSVNASAVVGGLIENCHIRTDGSYSTGDFESRGLILSGDAQTVLTVRNTTIAARRTVASSEKLIAAGIDADSEGTSILFDNCHFACTCSTGTGNTVCVGNMDGSGDILRATLRNCSFYSTSAGGTAYTIDASPSGSYVVVEAPQFMAGNLNGASNIYRVATGTTLTTLDAAVAGVFSTNASAYTTNSTLGAIVNDLENGGRLDNLLETIESTVSSNSTNAVATLANSVAILADTAEIGVAGAGLTEAGGTGDHLTAIDISGALATYDAPTRTEATADKDEVIAKLLAYVQLLARKDAAITTDNATELAEINADGGSGAGSYAATTDSQEAIRDRGDAAWVTGSASVNQPTALDRPEQLLKIGGRRDGVIRSPDIITIAPGETKVFGFHFPWGTRPRPADAVAPTGLTGELSASLVGDNGLAPEWVSVQVVATDSATDGTTDYAIVEVTDRDGNVLQLVAEIRVKALHP